MSKRQKVEEWLINQREILSILPLERKLGLSRGTIYKFLKYNRKLKITDIKIIDKYIHAMMAKYFE